jgi:hypothetical protein
MMVEERAKRDEEENSNFYSYDDNEEMNDRITDSASEHVEQVKAELDLNRRLDSVYYTRSAVCVEEKEADDQKSWFSFHHQCRLARWNELYYSDSHHLLRNKIIEQLVNNKAGEYDSDSQQN